MPSPAKTDRSAQVREAIRAAASRLFTAQGFVATGVRDIAREAGTDPALVIRHFGSKEALFLETVQVPDLWHDVLAGPTEAIGARMVRTIVEARGERLGAYTALIRASDRSEIRTKLQSSMAATVIEPVLQHLDPGNAELRAHVFAAVLDGLLNALAIREDPVLVGADVETVIEQFGPLLQHALDGGW